MFFLYGGSVRCTGGQLQPRPGTSTFVLFTRSHGDTVHGFHILRSIIRQKSILAFKVQKTTKGLDYDNSA